LHEVFKVAQRDAVGSHHRARDSHAGRLECGGVDVTRDAGTGPGQERRERHTLLPV